MTILWKELFLGFWVSYLASLPPGTISLSVIETTIQKGLKQAAMVAFGAIVIEFFQAYIATYFAAWMQGRPAIDQFIQISVIPIFLALSVYYYRESKKVKEMVLVEGARFRKRDSFMKGAIVSLLNPVAIPFWAFYSIVFQNNGWVLPRHLDIFFYVIGIILGTFLCQLTYAFAAALIRKRLKAVRKWVNIFIALIFLGMSVYQAFRLIWAEE